MLKQKLAISFFLLLCAGLLFAGGQQEPAGEPDVVTVMTWPIDSDTPLEERPVIKYLEEKLNIKIKWIYFPHSERGTAINLMIAGGGDMPDLFPSYTNEAAARLEEKGVILAWSDFMAAGDMPLTVAKLNKPENIGVKNQLTDLETGKIYGLPPFSVTDLLIWSDYIRGDWLEKLGLEVPTTTDELYDVLLAFKTQDPNGNGVDDEIPWMNFYSGVGWLNMWARDFGLKHPDYSQSTFSDHYWSIVNNEEVVFAPINERFKTMLQYLNRLWKAGLIHQEQFNMDSPKFSGAISNNTVGMQNMWPSAIPGMTEQLRQIDPNAVWLPIPYPIDSQYSDQDDRSYAKRGPVSFTWFLAKNGKNTEAAVRLAEYVFGNEEFQFIAEYGIEGETYKIGDDGLPYFIGKWAEMDTTTRQNELGSQVGRLMVELPRKELLRRVENDPIFAEYKVYLQQIAPYYKPATLWMLTDEQRDIGKAALTPVKDYIDESSTKFIIGTKPFSEWDAYVETIKNEAGTEIEVALEMYQAYFDQYVKAYY